MSISVRKAAPSDVPAMARLLNEIIEQGGTTAYETPFSTAEMEAEYISSPDVISCVVAEEGGQLLGFQGLFAPHADDPMPEGWCFIATFADVRSTGKGVGRQLFAATTQAARDAGLSTIDATIRADNASGLAFYERIGFVDYDRIVGVPLQDGTKVDRVRKKFAL